jgi:hypothetical protein
MAGATVEKITTLDVKPLGGNAAREIGTPCWWHVRAEQAVGTAPGR